MAYTYPTYPATGSGTFDISILTDIHKFYDPANLNFALGVSIFVFLVTLALIHLLTKPSKQTYKEVALVTFWFVAVDAGLHYFVEALEVPLFLYSVEKVLLTFIALVVLFWAKESYSNSKIFRSNHFISAVICLLLSYRYYLLYPDRAIFGINFTVVLFAMHYFILYFALQWVVNKEFKWEWY